MPDDASYNDSHRAFLQAFMAQGTMTYEESQPILAGIQSAYERREILPGDITLSDFQGYVSAVSSQVARYGYSIRSAVHQGSKARVYAFINEESDDLTQLATTLNADEISFVKRVLDAMFDAHNTPRREVCAVTATQALQLSKPRDADRRQSTQNGDTQGGGGGGGGSSGQGITMSNAEAVLKALVDQGWLEVSRKFFYSLSPRALMELRGWLIQTYNDEEDEDEDDDDGGGGSGNGGAARRRRAPRVKMCAACRDIVTVGQRCPTQTCPVRLHDMCTDRFFRMHKAARCPTCKSDWQGHGFVGERAANSGGGGPRRSTGVPSGRRRSAVDGAAESAPEEAEEEQQGAEEGEEEEEEAEGG